MNDSTTVRIFICYETPEKLLGFEPGLRDGEFGGKILTMQRRKNSLFVYHKAPQRNSDPTTNRSNYCKYATTSQRQTCQFGVYKF